MRQIDLQEYQQSEAIPLSITERDDLQAVLPSLTIVPAAGEDAAYHLTPSSTVGAVEIGDLSVLIRPKIGIPQLLSLACYAMGVFKSQEERLFDFQRRSGDTAGHACPRPCRRCAKGILTRTPPWLPHGGRGAAHRARAYQVRRSNTAEVRHPPARRGALRRVHRRHHREPTRQGSGYTPRWDAPALTASSPESGVDCGDARERVIR